MGPAVNRNVIRAVRFHQRANASVWASCIVARHVVGKRDGETAALAESLVLSPDRVEARAAAGNCYVFLRQWCEQRKSALSRLRECRAQLGYSHFERVWRAFIKHEFNPDLMLDILSRCVEERIPVEKIADLIPDGAHPKPSPVLPVWELNSETIRRLREMGRGRVVVLDGIVPDDAEYVRVTVAKERSR